MSANSVKSRGRIRVRIFYQCDPLGLTRGGIDSFIKGQIKAAPPDIEISTVGLTSDRISRPVGKWSSSEARDGRPVEFFPVGFLAQPGARGLMPLSARLALGVTRYMKACTSECDILEFHRFEFMLPLLRDPRPKNAFVHQNMQEVCRNSAADTRWKLVPRLYFCLEDVVLPCCNSVYCVRADAADLYRARYPHLADRFRFIPTWMDPDIFFPVDPSVRDSLRARLGNALNFMPSDQVIVSVGRLDEQKDPMLCIESFAVLHAWNHNTKLVFVGEGTLRSALVARARTLGLADCVTFTGLRPPEEVADLLRAADALILTSAYEGMPLCVIEALACGLPVVSIGVGEIHRVVHPGVNGQLIATRQPAAVARAALEVLLASHRYRGRPCTDAVRDYVPKTVLEPIFQNYRRLASLRVNRTSTHPGALDGEPDNVPRQ